MSLFRMAWRNIWRNTRRSLITLMALSFALFVCIVYAGLSSGLVKDMEHNAVALDLSDIQIHHPDYRTDYSLYDRIEDSGLLLARLKAQGLQASPRLYGFGLASSGSKSAAVQIRGVDPISEQQVTELHHHMLAGDYLDPDHPQGVVLGRKLARMLGVQPGDELVVVVQAADGSMGNDLYTVRGVFKAATQALDAAGLFMTENSFRSLFVLPQGAHEIALRRPAFLSLAEATAQARALAPDLEVLSWKKLNPTMAEIVDSTGAMLYFLYLIVYLAIGLVILNAMLMAVFERIREYGLMKALGMSGNQILQLVAAEVLLLCCLATFLGVAVGLPVAFYLEQDGINLSALAGNLAFAGVAMEPVWRTAVSPQTVIGPVVTLFFMTFLAVLYPALKAARLQPVQAMTHH